MSTSFLDDLSSFTDSESFRTSSDFLKQLNGFQDSQRAGGLARSAYGVQMDAYASSEAASIGAFQFNSAIELQNLATQLDAVRLNRDSVISQQRAESAARGLGTGSRIGLLLLNDTLSKAEDAAMDLRVQSQNRRRANELELGSALSEVRAKRAASTIEFNRQQSIRKSKTQKDALSLIQGGASAIQAIDGLFGGK